MSNTIYLYLKTHNVTGLKYLGKTEQDPFKYRGSGKQWLLHIKEHGYDVTTEILFETTDREEFAKVGTKYSEMWNIVESKEFANLVTECGNGAYNNTGKRFSKEWREKISISNTGWKHTEEAKDKIRKARSKQVTTEETRKKMSATRKGRKITWDLKSNTKEANEKRSKAIAGRPKPKVVCPHCKKEGGYPQMKQWHFDNCKKREN